MGVAFDRFRDVIRGNIRRLRNELGYTQIELSKESGFDSSYVGKIERGEADPSLESINRISRTLGVDPASLFLGNAGKSTVSLGQGAIRKDSSESDEDAIGKDDRRGELTEVIPEYGNRLTQPHPGDPVVLTSTDPDGRIIHYNRAFVDLTGEGPDELSEKELVEFVHESDQEPLKQYCQSVTEGSSPGPADIRFNVSNGDYKLFRVRSGILQSPGDEDPLLQVFLIKLTE
ncbi:MAG: helix-turn-helix domain-containing protein [bacterium]